MIPAERIRNLNDRPLKPGKYVLYWMQSSIRENWNLALEHAIRHANRTAVPVLAVFAFTPGYPEASLRHYAFLIDGLKAAGAALQDRGIRLVLHPSPAGGEIAGLASDASLVVTDRGYLALHRSWRESAAGEISCRLLQVEDNVVVPVETASSRQEWSAATLRRKIHRQLPKFLGPVKKTPRDRSSLDLDVEGIPWEEAALLLDSVRDREVSPVPGCQGGQKEAIRRLDTFIADRIERYPVQRNDPNAHALSDLSPYLHFGNISPVEIARRVIESRKTGTEEFLEELIVRRELSMNYVTFNPRYESYSGIPPWARETLDMHSRDPREYLYTGRVFSGARTHDPYWNAAQNELLYTGKMHGYMRMYWGKKILEWSESPEVGFRIAIALNNRYGMDGRDPNGYAGVAWCFGNHDRAWQERPVFGKVRYMNAAGLRRKFDADGYVARGEALSDRRGGS
jgi:deoxyribodipyrimidine photo-lyase